MKNNPLKRKVPEEIYLHDAPLVRVVAQLRFSIITSIEKQDFISNFQEAIREEYPVLRPEQTINVAVGPMGPVNNISSKIWRFINDKDGWKVSLSQNFIAIETSAYKSRTDFLHRWENILRAAVEHLKLRQYDRLGVRYVDRIQDGAMKHIKKFIKAEALSIMDSDGFSNDDIVHTFHETLFKIKDSQLLARWGKLSAKSTYDPSTIEPKADDSWVLDLDMFRLKNGVLDVDKIISDSTFYSERIYSLFRWMITDDFIAHYKGD